MFKEVEIYSVAKDGQRVGVRVADKDPNIDGNEVACILRTGEFSEARSGWEVC